MNYIQISIDADEQQQEVLISELADLDALGFEQKPSNLLAYFDEESFKAFEVKILLQQHEYNLQTIPKQNWNTIWENNFEPVIVDNFCAIRADFHQPINGVEHEIIITPKMSFGTGHHETTYMMIEEMRNIDFAGKKVFDFGTGTGILSILASKLGAASIIAIDVDEWSITNAAENFEKNNVLSVNLSQSTILPASSFDIILANINRNVLVEYASSLVDILSTNGILLISGLLKEDVEFIVDAFDRLDLKKDKQKEKWMMLLFSAKYNSYVN